MNTEHQELPVNEITLPDGYSTRRQSIAKYFDKTAVDAWERLTSDAPVSGIRATVRAGRDEMRELLLHWLPADLRGLRIFDAGCGTGALAVEAASRGALVTAVDISENLVDIAKRRTPRELQNQIDYRAGDFAQVMAMNPDGYDFVVAMDSLIHYPIADIEQVLSQFARATTQGIAFTFAPRTPLLTAMHTLGRLFPRSDRAPAIIPVAANDIAQRLSNDIRFRDFRVSRTQRVDSSFYKSQAMMLAHI